jgi:hypothetical protein
MKILITNNRLGDVPGGSEWHAYELALAMKRKGYEVEAYSGVLGWFSNNLMKNEISVHNSPPEEKYDLIIASHLSTINKIDRSKTKGRMVQVCHGKYPALEQPSNKVDFHVSISEEVKNHLRDNGFDSKVIYNGVNHNKFVESPEGVGVLSLCQGKFANNLVREACKIVGCDVTVMNKYEKYTYNLHEKIPSYNTVISLGRGAFEAMACNKRLIVADSREYVSTKNVLYDGSVNLSNVEELMKNNCSGRRYGMTIGVDEMARLIDKSMSCENPNLREFSLKNLNIDVQADKYISMT